MSELVKRLHDAENLCSQWGFSGSARAIFDARKRITELEAGLADSNEAQQVMGLKLAHAEADVVRVQAMHEGLMKNADQMNAELEAENARLRVDADELRNAAADMLKRVNANQSPEGLLTSNQWKPMAWLDLSRAVKKYNAARKDQSHSANTVGDQTPPPPTPAEIERLVDDLRWWARCGDQFTDKSEAAKAALMAAIKNYGAKNGQT